METIRLTLPDGLKGKAHEVGINISAVCADALRSEIVKVKKMNKKLEEEI